MEWNQDKRTIKIEQKVLTYNQQNFDKPIIIISDKTQQQKKYENFVSLERVFKNKILFLIQWRISDG